MILVIAGNFHEYANWVREHVGLNAVYISHADKLRGLDFKKHELVFYGTWKERSDAGEIIRLSDTPGTR